MTALLTGSSTSIEVMIAELGDGMLPLPGDTLILPNTHTQTFEWIHHKRDAEYVKFTRNTFELIYCINDAEYIKFKCRKKEEAAASTDNKVESDKTYISCSMAAYTT